MSSHTTPGLTCPPHAHACPTWAPFPAGHTVSVYKDLGMMSPFLPDLQLFSLMLCCLGGPLWGSLPCVPHPRPLLFHVVNTWGRGGMGVQARETTGGGGGDGGYICLSAELGFYLIFFLKNTNLYFFGTVALCPGGRSPLRLALPHPDKHRRGALRLWGQLDRGGMTVPLAWLGELGAGRFAQGVADCCPQ